MATSPGNGNGDLYVDEGDAIHVFDSTGASLYSFGSPADFGTDSAAVGVNGSNGRAYVADPTAKQVDVFAPASSPPVYQSSFGSDNSTNPQAVTVDQQNGDVYVTDTFAGKVFRYTASGLPDDFTCGTCSSNALSGMGFDGGGTAVEVAIDRSGGPANGDIYVAAGIDDVVYVFANDGTPLGTLDGSTTPNNFYSEACGVAVDQSNGNVYVGDYGTSVWRYTPSGGHVTNANYSGGITTAFNPCQVAADRGHVYAVDWTNSGPAVRYSASSFALSPTSQAGTVVDPTAKAVATSPGNGNGDLYVDEGDAIHVFDSTGASLYSFGSPADFGTDSAAVGVNGSNGRAYVADPTAKQVDVFAISAGGPTAVTNAATAIHHTSATLNGHLDPSTDPGVTDCHFDWGTDTNYTGGAVPCAEGNSFTSAADVSANLPGLTPGTTYHFRLVISTTSSGDILGVDRSFTAPPFAPTTNAATAIHHTFATLNGHLDPEGETPLNVTECHFDWGTDTSYTGGTVPCAEGNSFASAADVSAALPNLTPGTPVHFRLHLTSASAGEFTGADKSFTPLAFPIATNAANPIHHTSATLNGHLDPEGEAGIFVTECHFDWGTDTSYSGGTLPCAQGNSFNAAADVSANLPNLHPGDTYHFRLHLTTASAGEVPGGDQVTGPDKTFTAVPYPIATNAATAIHHTDAVLNGHLDPDGDSALNVTECHFDWGTDTSYSGGTLPCAQGNNFSAAADVSALLNNLTPGDGYHYRLCVSTAAVGDFCGADRTVAPLPFPSDRIYLDTVGSPGSGDGQLSGNTGIGVRQGAGGPVYVADTANHRIVKLDADGNFLRTWGWGVDDGTAAAQICTSGCQAGVPGSGAGQFDTPRYVAVDNSGGPSDGDVYVGDTATDMVQKFDPSGNLVTAWAGSPAPGQLDGAADSVYVADPLHGRVDVFTGGAGSTYTFSRSFGSFGAGDPQALDFDPTTGDVYVVSPGAGTVSRFHSSGAPDNFTCAGCSGNTLGGFAFKAGPGATQIAIDRVSQSRQGDFYVTDTLHGTVKEFASDGTLLSTIDGHTTPNGPFSQPCGVAITRDAPGAAGLAVADYSGHISRYFSNNGGPFTDAGYRDGIATSFHPCQLAGDVHQTRVYAADWDGGGPVYSFPISSFAAGAPAVAGTQVDAKGTALAIDTNTERLYVDEGDGVSLFDAQGNFKLSFGSAADFGSASAGIALGRIPLEGWKSFLGGIAVDSAGGLSVGANGQGSYGTSVWTFGAEDGRFSSFFVASEGAATLATPGAGLAIDPDGNYFGGQTFGSVFKISPTLHLDPLGQLVRLLGQVSHSQPQNLDIAVDPASGDLYAARADSIARYHFTGPAVLEPDASTCPLPTTGNLEANSCDPTETFGSGQLTAAAGVGVNGADGRVYVSDSGAVVIFGSGTPKKAPTLTLDGPSAIAGSSATLHGKVDPETFQVTDCHFEAVPQSQFGVDGFASVTAAEKFPCAPDPGSGSGDVAVSADASGLNAGTTYHFRLLASNAQPNGAAVTPDQTFDTPGPLVSGESADHVSDSAVTLHATINPAGHSTGYHFEYVTDAEFGAHGYTNAASFPSSDASIGSGNIAVAVAERLTGLTPATKYRFRLVATNSVGVDRGIGSTFTTHSSPPDFSGDNCPNADLRNDGPGASLPDCRAYEQASPVDKHGGNIAHDLNVVQASTNGDRVTFAEPAGLPTTGGSSSLSAFVASRGAGGWSTNGLIPAGPPGSLSALMGWSEDLAASASSSPTNGGGIYLGDTAAGTWQEQAATAGAGSSPFLAGFAADTAHLIFESPTAIAPGAVHGPVTVGGDVQGLQNLYDLDHGALTLAGRVPPFPATGCDDSTHAPDCVAPAGGSFAGPYIWQGTGSIVTADLNGGGVAYRYYPQHTLSADGSKVFFTEGGTGRLYMREDGSKTIQVSASHKTNGGGPGGIDSNGHKPAAFLAATPDGATVYFSSCEQLTNDSTAVSTAANDCSSDSQGSDLYVYDTATGDLTDLTADPGAGPQGRPGPGYARRLRRRLRCLLRRQRRPRRRRHPRQLFRRHRRRLPVVQPLPFPRWGRSRLHRPPRRRRRSHRLAGVRCSQSGCQGSDGGREWRPPLQLHPVAHRLRQHQFRL